MKVTNTNENIILIQKEEKQNREENVYVLKKLMIQVQEKNLTRKQLFLFIKYIKYDTQS